MMFLIDDFRQAWRGLRNSPGFLALAASVLALGLGATIFTYGVINTTMQKPPPLPHAERIMAVFGAEPARSEKFEDINYLDYLELRDHQKSFESFAAYYSGTMIISGEGLPERYTGGFITHEFMGVHGVKPFLGRDFNEVDDIPNAEPVVILSYDLWRTRFSRDENILGKVIRVGSVPTTIVGVMPSGFNFPQAEALWIPMARDPAKELRGAQHAGTFIGVGAIGRLKPGVTRAAANDDLAAIAGQLAKQYPRTNVGTTTTVIPLAEGQVGQARRLLYTMFGAVWLVLLIACANVASLIFVRANFRVYEASMRVALGARRPRLITQMLAESVLISLIGLGGGLVLAALALSWFDRLVRSDVEFPSPAWWTFSIDLKVALFAAAAALFAGVISGIVPALRASRPDVMRILRDGGRTGTGLRLSKFTTAMVVLEVALSAALLTGAGLMTRSAFTSLQQDYGADVSGFMSARVGLPPSYSDPERQARFFQQIVADLRDKPGVLAATAATSMPGVGAPELLIALDGRNYGTRADFPAVQVVIIAPGFFDAFSRPLLRGRAFDSGDRYGAPHVVVVNQAFVETHFAGENPLGRRLRISPEEENAQWATIIGVAPNINHSHEWSEGGFPPTVYRSVTQQPWRFLTVAIKTEGNARAYGEVLRQAARKIDPDLTVYWMMTLDEYQAQSRFALRLLSRIFIAFACIAIILAAVGIYGVLSFATGQRNREIGVRRALGAQDRQILRAVMRGAAVQLIVGLAIGAFLAPLIGRLLDDGLQGMPADDPVVYAIVFAVLVVAAIVASWIPAMRALRVQPATALRHE